MAAPRATQWIALRNIARNASGAHQQVRSLHMTGPATYASPVLTKERPFLNLPRDLAGLRAECKRRKIDTAGSVQELTARLNADEIAHSRAFRTMADRRPTATAATEPVTGSSKRVRHFNTSRALKSVNDSSTIDFAYLPEEEAPQTADPFAAVRMPMLPTTTFVNTTALEPEALEPAVMKPRISVMSADTVYLPMAEMSDGHAMNIDFHAMADTVAANLRHISAPIEEQAGVMKQIWSDMVDDVLAGLAKPKNLAV